MSMIMTSCSVIHVLLFSLVHRTIGTMIATTAVCCYLLYPLYVVYIQCIMENFGPWLILSVCAPVFP